MTRSAKPVALITGGSGGLGFAIAEAFLGERYSVLIVGRDPGRLRDAVESSRAHFGQEVVEGVACDVSRADEVVNLPREVDDRFGRLDVLVNCVGQSDRGLAENLRPDRLQELIEHNVSTALRCSQALIPMLEKQSGVIVNIGSLAGKVGPRYMGGYAAAKHALAGLTQQMRLELRPRGIHVALVSPGPIRRPDAGKRYTNRLDPCLPKQAAAPGGGTKVKGLPPTVVADRVVRCVRRRQPDVVVPGYLRWLIAFGHLIAPLGDRLLLRFTSVRDE
jgi:NAD(P)-dependent dehydrogenase (short-subunit alcohol dehydrogenase family)